MNTLKTFDYHLLGRDRFARAFCLIAVADFEVSKEKYYLTLDCIISWLRFTRFGRGQIYHKPSWVFFHYRRLHAVGTHYLFVLCV